jgi:predicted deacylase
MKIILNIATHGDETIGHAVAKVIEKLKLIQGEVIIHVANEKAYLLKTRFIDQDLNRSFPGDKNGNHEQKLAFKILPIIKEADLVIDIHSTTSQLKNALIVTKFDKKTKNIIDVINPKYLLYMRATKNNALISAAKIGIAFEYGGDKDKKVIQKTISDIKNLLTYLGMIKGKFKKTKSKTEFFDVYGVASKPEGFELKKSIKNYKLVKMGEVYSISGKEKITAKKDFYPILFGEKKYKDMFGFVAKKII